MNVGLLIAGATVAAAGVRTSIVPLALAQQRSAPAQIAQASHWLIGTWVWTSEWGPIVLTFKSVDVKGQPVGRIESQRANLFRDCDAKPGAATMVCTLTGSNLHIQFSTGEYQLARQGNSLVGKYNTPRIVRDAHFVKR